MFAALVLAMTLASGEDAPPPFIVSPSSVVNVVVPIAPALADQCTGATLITNEGDSVTCSRASQATCTKADGTVVTLGTNTCRVGPNGLFGEGAVTNRALRSEEIDSASWSKIGVTVTANTDVAPNGSTTMDAVEDTSAVADGYVHQTVAASTQGQYTCSVFLKAGTQNAARIFFAGTGNTAGNTSCAINGISSTTTRYSCTSGSYGTGLTNVRCEFVVGANAAATGSLKMWGMQIESGSVASSYIPTSGTASMRSADTNVTANRLPERDWCIGSTIKANGTFTTGTFRSLLQLGIDGTANSAQLQVNPSGALRFYVYDEAGGVRICTTSNAVGTATARVVACSISGTLSLYRDGAAITCITSGSGSGVISTQPSSFYLTAHSGGGPDGWQLDVRQCKSLGGCL